MAFARPKLPNLVTMSAPHGTPNLPGGYRLEDGGPSPDDYLTLRVRSGLSPRRRDQALAGLGGEWSSVHVVHQPTGATVGMGRVIGDGGWYFHILDTAVLPEHQRRGLGDAILDALLRAIRRGAPQGAFVSLLADEPGRSLYSRHGFVPTAPRSIGMALTL